MPLGRPRKYDDEFHRKLRERVALHRRRKAAEIAARAERRRIAAGRKPPAHEKRWRLYERIETRGVTADVLLSQADTPPSGYAAGGWLPGGLLPFHLGGLIAAARRRQLRDWLSIR